MADAARNLALDVAQTAQADPALGAGARIFAVGLGGADLEANSDFLLRATNDEDSPAFSAARPKGKFLFAPSTAELQSAFDEIRSQVIRLTR